MLDYNKICEGTSYYKTTAETYFTNRLKSKIKKLFDKATNNPEKRHNILDIGCYIGTDIFMLGLGKKNIQFYGTDISKEVIKRAKMLTKFRNVKNVEFKVSDSNKKLPFKDNFFDLIICSEVIEHLKNPSKFLKDCHKKLKKGGSLIVTTPNLGYPFIKFGKLINVNKFREQEFTRIGKTITKEDWDEKGHISLMNNKELFKLLKNNNFEITANEGVSIFGGNSFFDYHLTALSIMILLDSIFHRFKSLSHGILISAKALK